MGLPDSLLSVKILAISWLSVLPDLSYFYLTKISEEHSSASDLFQNFLNITKYIPVSAKRFGRTLQKTKMHNASMVLHS